MTSSLISTISSYVENMVKKELFAITRAYIYVSTDAIAGPDHVKETYYTRIWEVYRTKNPKDIVERPVSSVQTRLKMITVEFVYLSSCFKKIKNKKNSGHNEDERVHLATALFNKKRWRTHVKTSKICLFFVVLVPAPQPASVPGCIFANANDI